MHFGCPNAVEFVSVLTGEFLGNQSQRGLSTSGFHSICVERLLANLVQTAFDNVRRC
jgi:hypothetical protein